LVEERINFFPGREYYISISYDTDYRSLIITFSKKGGTGVEGSTGKTEIYPLSPLEDKLPRIDVRYDVLKKLVDVFYQNDCLLLEINPLVEVSDDWFALDAKIKLDDSALNRHKEWDFFSRLVPGHIETEREVKAKKIDEGDYRGTAGSTYFDLPGDIAVLASGGGASLTAMDALVKAGGAPANYTEYSGNPSREKVQKLTEIVLSKPNLNGLWVIGAIANFTDIYETMSGFVDGLREAEKTLNTKFEFPILIRRGGPKDKEAFQMLKSLKGLNLHIYGEEISITESAKIMVKLASQYASSR
ncbi:MAG TPA: ATP citrate lyase citrate-binding domain-containing protein, partial [Candidatus Paceibacterota bacterium]